MAAPRILHHTSEEDAMYHYGPDSDFERYYFELNSGPDKRGNRPLEDERPELIVFPRIMSAIAGLAVFLSAVVILINVAS
jgi:hypothetical protein